MRCRIALCAVLCLVTVSCGGGDDDFGDCVGTLGGVPVRYVLSPGFSRYSVENEPNLAVVRMRFEDESGATFFVDRGAVDADLVAPTGPVPLFEGRPDWVRAWSESGLSPISGTLEILSLSEEAFVATFAYELSGGDDMECLVELHR